MPDYDALPLSRVEHDRKNRPPGFKESGARQKPRSGWDSDR